MPILPLDYPEPFAATVGVMLYPDKRDEHKARALAAQWLAEPLKRYHLAGHQLPYDALLRIATDAGELLRDRDDRCWGGTATGELFKTLWALYNTKPELTSWNNAIKIAEKVAATAGSKGSRTDQWNARRRFLSVAHLWGAWSIRGGQFRECLDVGYDGYADFQSFLTEAEILREWGQTWRPARAKSEPLLPAEVWRVPERWAPPERRAGWPKTGIIPILHLPDDLIAVLNPPGRPRKGR